MQPRNFDTAEIAKSACEYARKSIIAGSTQIQNSDFDEAKRVALTKGIKDLRAFRKEASESRIESDAGIEFFYANIATCKKFSLGNCSEMALMALDYVLSHAPEVNAEVYRIAEGDHAFLMIGRIEGSDPTKPETWGGDAYICDPWCNQVYPASEYVDKMEFFSFSPMPSKEDCRYYTASVTKFNSKQHSLKLLWDDKNDMNTKYLRKANSRAHIDQFIARYREKLESIHQVLETLHLQMSLIVLQFEQKYPVIGGQKKKRITIQAMLLQLEKRMEAIKKDIENVAELKHEDLPYSELREKLEGSLKRHTLSSAKILNLSNEDKSVLMKHRYENVITGKVLGFFKAPRTARDACSALNRASETIQSILKK
ncbi:MAG TPA: hypothetical protein VNC84_02115 [Gammaproteobacteria bacterium]|jgi:hypothetical protein|nr:hypothetical protein [Gammaproteobacteria bacterium]